MEMDIEYLARFEQQLEQDLLRLCTEYKMLDGTLLESEDINEHWKVLAPEYMADAVPEIANYPTVSVSWAAYLGLAIAYAWDVDWKTFVGYPYQSYYGDEGFDNMDEHIVRDLLRLPLDSKEAKEIEEILRRCGEATVSKIRREHIEPQSKRAFYVFSKAVRTMYRIGAAIELKRLGYKFEKVQLGTQADA